MNPLLAETVRSQMGICRHECDGGTSERCMRVSNFYVCVNVTLVIFVEFSITLCRKRLCFNPAWAFLHQVHENSCGQVSLEQFRNMTDGTFVCPMVPVLRSSFRPFLPNRQPTGAHSLLCNSKLSVWRWKANCRTFSNHTEQTKARHRSNAIQQSYG